MAQSFFSEAQQAEIVDAIKQAELNTSGEIRVHLEAKCKGDAYDRALEVFTQLGMHATELHNGVLFYVAYKDKKFAIIGDKGIHEKVKQHFWDSQKELLVSHFKDSKFTEGLTKAIIETGNKLKAHFPYMKTDTNELSNEISFGGNDHV